MSDVSVNTNPETFAELQAISRLTRFPEQASEGRERLIRFLDSHSTASGETPIVDSLCARFGLYPYMSAGAVRDEAAALAVEYHSPESLARLGFTFHSQQQAVYEQLMDGTNVILSAPTSFGKSIVVDALVASEKWSTIVLIVPTIALIDETRRRLKATEFGYTVVTHPSQPWGERNIFVMTQERYLELPEDPPVEFFMIDEFYKLGAAESQDARRTLLNIAWNRLRSTGAQFYLTGPNVDALHADLGEELRASLVTTDFKTVAVDVDDRSSTQDWLTDLKSFLREDAQGATLIFVGSPAKAANLALELEPGSEEAFVLTLSDWVSRNYDEGWYVVDALRKGIGVHTGPLPRSLQRAMVRLFEEGRLEVLVCTSTLIEGVNTVAKNVVIYERSIDRQPIDYFTFSNIRGRAGRMLKHFVGRVITYSSPPLEMPTLVDIPIESQSQLASLSTLIQLDETELTPESRERVSHILHQDFLSLQTIRANRGLDPDNQIQVAQAVRAMPREMQSRLSWSGRPTNQQARAVLELAFDGLLEPGQRRGMNFNILWGKLQSVRESGGDLSEMVDRQARFARPGQTRSDLVDDMLRFQRNWMGFTIPLMIRGVQAIQSEILPDTGLQRGNYEFFLREIESLYLPSNVADLEEYGLPLPLALKLVSLGLGGDTLSDMLGQLASLARQPGVLTKLDDVEKWFLADVVDGLEGELPPPG